jgi:hypothetical protein
MVEESCFQSHPEEADLDPMATVRIDFHQYWWDHYRRAIFMANLMIVEPCQRDLLLEHQLLLMEPHQIDLASTVLLWRQIEISTQLALEHFPKKDLLEAFPLKVFGPS